MTIRITGDGPKITATGSGSTVLVEISTGQHDPGSFSGVHNDLTGRSTAGAHPISAITGLQEALDNAGGGGGGGTGDVVGPASAVDGKVVLFDGTTGKLVKDSGVTLGGAASLAVGTTAGTVAAGDDARLSDARTPTAHASSHASAGSDPVTLAQSQVTNLTTDLAGKAASSHSHAGTDITSGTVGTARLGSGSASSSTFLRGDQTWATPSGIADPGGSNDDFLQRKSGAWTNRTVAQVKTDLGVDQPLVIPTGVYSFGIPSHSGFSNSAVSAGVLTAHHIYIPKGTTVDRIGVVINSLAASSTLRLGIYAQNSDGTPGVQLVAHAGTLDGSSTGLKEATISHVGTGWCWAVCQTQTSGTPCLSRAPTTVHQPLPVAAADVETTTSINRLLFVARNDAALPADLTGTSWTVNNSIPHGIMFRGV